MQYQRTTRTKNCFVLLDKRAGARRDWEVAKIKHFYWFLWNQKQYAIAQVQIFHKLQQDEAPGGFKVLLPTISPRKVLIPVVRIVKKVVLLTFTDVLKQFHRQVTLALGDYK